MAQHRYLETDGVPAPSDFELEDAAWARTAGYGRLTFNQFIRLIGLTSSREQFHAYIKGAGLAGTRQTYAAWWKWFDRMLKGQDAQDQADTQNDALL